MLDLLNHWSGVLALVALVLAFPMSVFANLLTPKFQDWWNRSAHKSTTVTGSLIDSDQAVTHTDSLRILERHSAHECAPIRLRLFASVIDALVVVLLGALFGTALLVTFSLSARRFSFEAILAAPWFVVIGLPIGLSLGYKSLWATFNRPTIGLQRLGLDVISMDGNLPTTGQRMVRAFAGWLTMGGVVGALWAVVSQERYSMQDMISQTFITRADLCRHVPATNRKLAR